MDSMSTYLTYEDISTAERKMIVCVFHFEPHSFQNCILHPTFNPCLEKNIKIFPLNKCNFSFV